MIGAETPRVSDSSSLFTRVARSLNLDGPLLLGLIALASIGMIVLYSAGGESFALLTRQAIRLAVAFTVLIIFAQLTPHMLRLWTPWIFIGGIILLIAVLYGGDVGRGAQRWLDLGFIRFQPAEIMKLAVPMMIAWYLHDKPLPPSFLQVLVVGMLVAFPVALIAKQPDLGTAVLIASAGAFAVFLAGIRWRIILLIFAAAVPALIIFWKYYMRDYQRQRVLTFFNPESDPLNSGYHIIQSKIAIGSGGLFGKGWANGTQSQLDFLPERSTDFIFAVLGEEFGLLGAVMVLLVYAFIIARGLYISSQAEKTFGRLLAGSLILTFFVYLFVNVGMVSGLVPVVGIPLPLISYGGTSMVTLMAGFGILMSIHSNRKLMARQRPL